MAKKTDSVEEMLKEAAARQRAYQRIDEYLRQFSRNKVSDILPFLERRCPELVPYARERVSQEEGEKDDEPPRNAALPAIEILPINLSAPPPIVW